MHVLSSNNLGYIPLFSTSNYSAGAIPNTLAISTDDISLNKTGYVYGGYSSNLPSDCISAIREVYFYNKQDITVKLTGVDSNRNGGIIWTNHFNGNTWSGWVRVAFKEDFANSLGNYIIEAGETWLYCNYGSNVFEITYTKTFSSPPFVVVSPRHGTGNSTTIKIKERTTTSCTGFIDINNNGGTVTYGINYIAIGF